ncbi:MAG: glutamyl-tRNA reductase [Flavobacteriales bacterium]
MAFNFVPDLGQLTEKNQYLYAGLAQFSVFGISHNELPASKREGYSLDESTQARLISQLKALQCENIMVLSTCNRTEIYLKTNSLERTIDYYLGLITGDSQTFKANCYTKYGLDAVKHLFQVSAGLNSQIIGDFEIIGQVRKAFKISKELGCSGTFLERLVNSATQMSKRIKNQTEFSSGVTSTAYAAVRHVRDSFSDVTDLKVSIYGLGKIGRNVCENLVRHIPSQNVRILNRSVEKAVELAKRYNIDVFGEDILKPSIELSDVLIVATGASVPTVQKHMIPTNKNLLIIDLSVPRNVNPEIDQLPNCTVLGVDEISKMNDETLKQRMLEVEKVTEILNEEMGKFVEWMASRKHASAIQAIKSNFKDFQHKELLKAKKNPADEQVQNEIGISDKVINRITGQIFAKLKDLDEKELDTVYKLFSLDKDAL